jgi:hypothetical protein
LIRAHLLLHLKKPDQIRQHRSFERPGHQMFRVLIDRSLYRLRCLLAFCFDPHHCLSPFAFPDDSGAQLNFLNEH